MSRLIRFGVEYRSESSYWLLMRLSGMSLCSPTRSWSAGLLQDGREPCTDDEVRVEHEAETRRMWLLKGKENKAVRGPQESELIALRGTEPDDQENEDPPHRGKPERRADPPS